MSLPAPPLSLRLSFRVAPIGTYRGAATAFALLVGRLAHEGREAVDQGLPAHPMSLHLAPIGEIHPIAPAA